MATKILINQQVADHNHCLHDELINVVFLHMRRIKLNQSDKQQDEIIRFAGFCYFRQPVQQKRRHLLIKVGDIFTIFRKCMQKIKPNRCFFMIFMVNNYAKYLRAEYAGQLTFLLLHQSLQNLIGKLTLLTGAVIRKIPDAGP